MKVTKADIAAADGALDDLRAAQVLERMPADLAAALVSGILTGEQWASLARRDLAGKTKDRWSREPYWLTAMGRKVRRLIQEKEKA